MLFKQGFAAALLAMGAGASTAADLIGDTLTFTRSWPTPADAYTVWVPYQVSTTVAAGTLDTIQWNAGAAPLTIDASANQIVFTFGSSTGYGSPNPKIFDGFVITGFRHDILSANIMSETLPGAPNLQVFGRQLNLHINSSVAAGQSIVLGVSVVPEPSRWALLLGGVAALGALVRRRTGKD